MGVVTSETRHFTASGVVVDWRRSVPVLLLVHHKVMGLWVFPGGHVDENESPDETVVREIREETGLQVEHSARRVGLLPDPLEVAEHHAPEKPERPGKPAEPEHRHIDFLYLMNGDSRAPLKTAPDEVGGARWFTLAEINWLDQSEQSRPDVLRVARALLHGKF